LRVRRGKKRSTKGRKNIQSSRRKRPQILRGWFLYERKKAAMNVEEKRRGKLKKSGREKNY